MWEIMTYGLKPWQSVKNVEVLRLIEDNKRLEKPDQCPNDLYQLMLECWQLDDASRPTFTRLQGELRFELFL